MIQLLHQLPEGGEIRTAGRVAKTSRGWEIFNLYCRYQLDVSSSRGADGANAGPVEGALVRVVGRRRGKVLVVDDLEVVSVVGAAMKDVARGSGLQRAELARRLGLRAKVRRQVRAFFEERGFLEVETEALTGGPGTDPHLEPLAVALHRFDGSVMEGAYLHTSPELKMKELLALGAGRIYQWGRVWRDGELTERHRPEFTMLEWYRPWEEMEAIVQDVEALVGEVLVDSARPLRGPIERITMQEAVQEACGFDLLAHLEEETLREEMLERGMISERGAKAARGWDELFFSLTVSHLDPFLARFGAVFLTHWPAPLAVLAKRDAEDDRVAERFELYVDGVELANGFGELTDPREQRRRFEEDNDQRRRLGGEEIALNEGFLDALEYGMPPSAGVALGVDRLLMIAAGVEEIAAVSAFGGQFRPEFLPSSQS